MNIAAHNLLLLALPAAMGMVVVTGARAADAVKPGQWEFQTQLQGAGAGMAVTHRQCVEPDKAVPSDPRRGCKVDRMERSGNVISWSTTCDTAQGTVISTGTARYRGDMMEANLNVRAPNAQGGFIETRQHITGRYLGPCPAR